MRKVIIFLTVLLLSVNIFAFNVNADNLSKIVFITENGSKYHEVQCRYLYNSAIAILVEEAESKGYEKCSVCFTKVKQNESDKTDNNIKYNINDSYVEKELLIKIIITVFPLCLICGKLFKKKF